MLPQLLNNPLILTVLLPADPVALIDDNQGVFIFELLKIGRHRLHTGKSHLMLIVLTL